MSEIKCTYPMTNRWRGSNYIEDTKIAQERYQLKSTGRIPIAKGKSIHKEASNQGIQNQLSKKDIMIKSTECSKNQEGTPQGTCTMKRFVFQYGAHNMESSLPPRWFRTQKGARLYS
jgi:hypothetical protein